MTFTLVFMMMRTRTYGSATPIVLEFPNHALAEAAAQKMKEQFRYTGYKIEYVILEK